MPSKRTSAIELPDVNVLVSLLHPDHVHHALASDWFTSVARYATTPITEAGFLRLALNPAVAGVEIAPAVALESLRSVRSDSRAEFIEDDSSLADPSIELSGLSGFRQITDLHLVNLAVRHRAVLTTFDRRLLTCLIRRDQRHVRLLG